MAFIVPSVVLKVWINGFCNNCQNIKTLIGTSHFQMVEDIVVFWRNLKDGFGLFFLFHFAVTQVLCVVLVFLVVFDGLNGEFVRTLDQKSTLFLFVSIGKKITKIEILTLPYIFPVLNLLSISQVAEDGYKALQNVADNIQIEIRLPRQPIQKEKF